MPERLRRVLWYGNCLSGVSSFLYNYLSLLVPNFSLLKTSKIPILQQIQRRLFFMKITVASGLRAALHYLIINYLCRKCQNLKGNQFVKRDKHYSFCATGCRLPGNVNTPDQFWDVIKNGRNVIADVPPNRWNLETFYDKGRKQTGKIISSRGGFIENIDKFDNTFFNISPREAAAMDPQQRHLLEVTYEAFEDAGIDPWGLNAHCGVFIGIAMMDYSILTCDSNMMDAYSLTGTTHSVAANRLSYVFNFKGPSLAVDTACASSMTALHLACSALRNKECSVAVVGGCNNLLLPDISVGFSALGVMSPDGQCCPFSDTAKGYVRSEGWGTLILKPLDQARSNEDHIYAVILGNAIAASGNSSSLTKPSVSAQKDVMNEVYKRYNILPSSIDYVEAHGTGTPVGDPVEAEAISKTFSPHRKRSVKMGSVKGNFGHNEGASGVTALIKGALMLERQTLCPTINFQSPNPNIAFENLKLEVATKLEAFESEPFERVAINSFGFAGAVAHAVLERPPPQRKKEHYCSDWKFGEEKSGEHIIIPLSARSKSALEDLVKEWIPFRSPVDALSVVSWLSTRRKHHDVRLAVISNSGSDFRGLLTRYLSGDDSEERIITQALQTKKEKVCFVFPGQGQQWAGMGHRLYRTEQPFRKAIDKCDEIFKKISGTSLVRDFGLFQAPEGRARSVIHEIDISQPAILFLQLGLIELWTHWGVHPDVVVGHSLGEVAAAYACGGLTTEEAVKVIYHRSKEQRKLSGTGSMAAVRRPLELVEEMCSKHQDLYVAAINGPSSITIAGQSAGVDRITQENPTIAKKLRVQCAFHSPHMESIKDAFERSMTGVVATKKRFKQVPLYSTVTGRRYDGDFGTEYWWENIRKPVQFQSAIECILKEEQPDVFLELCSSVTLLSSIRQINSNQPNDSNISTIASCQRNNDDRVSILNALGTLYVAGKPIDWENVTHKTAQWQPLPRYQWQHQSHWKESEDRKNIRLGIEDRSFKGQNGHLSLNKYPFFKDHVIQNQLIFPGAGYVEYLLQSCFREDENPSLSNVQFIRTLMWSDDEDKDATSGDVTLSLEVLKEGPHFHVSCKDVVFCKAEVGQKESSSPQFIQVASIRSNLEETIAKEEFYRRLRKNGLEYGPAFQVVNQVLLGDGEALGYLDVALDRVQRIHTTILDGCLQLIIAALGPCSSLYIPIKICIFRMKVPAIPLGEDLVAHASVVDCDGAFLTGDVSLATKDGKILALLKGVQIQAISNSKTRQVAEECLFTTIMDPLQANLSLAALETELTEKYLHWNHPGDLRVIEEADKYVPEINAIMDAYVHQAVYRNTAVDGKNGSVPYIQRFSSKGRISHGDVAKAMQDIKEALPELREELDVIRQFGETLPAILEDPNSEQNQHVGREWWEKYLWSSFATRMHIKATASVIAQVIQAGFKTKSVIRVLVINDRNADLTKYTLPHIKEEGIKQGLEFTFSASSNFILSNAQEQLREFPFVRYKYFDAKIDKDDEEFVPESFDLVLCLHALHSPANANQNIQRIRRLLRQRGCLLIYEVTELNRLSEFLLLPLSLSQKVDAKNHCLSSTQWEEIMTSNGFIDVFSAKASHDCFPSVIAGCKCEKATGSFLDKEITMIAKKDNRFAQVLQQHLKHSRGLERVSDVREMFQDDISAVNLHNPRIVLYLHSTSSDQHLSYLMALFQETNTKKVSSIESLWVLTCDANASEDMEGSAAIGLTRAIGNCIHKFPIFSVEVDPAISPERNAFHICNLLTAPPPDREIVINQDRCFVPRILPFTLTESKEIRTHTWKIGFSKSDTSAKHSVDELHFLAAEHAPLADDEVLVEIRAAGLNFKDVMISMGMLEKLQVSEEGFGLECSGFVTDTGDSVTRFEIGDEVVVFSNSCFASHVKCSQERVIHKPQNLNWAEGAGVGIVLTTAFYCLVERAGLKTGETVLIHSACGGVGLAAVQVAQMVGATVICSAGTEEKRQFLKDTMSIKHVTDSRSEQFYHDVMTWTDCKGVDVVLNSLHGELMTKSIALLSHGGRFCEIGKRDILENTQISMQMFLENKSFLSCHVDVLLRQEPQTFRRNLERVFELLIEGSLKPVTTTVCSVSAFKETFRMMSKGEHIGKIVFDVSSEPYQTCLQNTASLFKANGTYIITGAFGGIGLAMARWMCKQGAKHLVLTSLHGCHNASGRRTLAFLKSQGVVVYEFAGDISNEAFVQTMINNINQNSSIPAIRGVFHLAGIIMEEDNFLQVRPDQLKLMFDSKARGAQYLHDHTLDQSLDMFLLMSSQVTVWGNPAQPSYCAANSYLDALAHHRHRLGVPALSLQLGAVRGAGFLEDKPGVTQRLSDKGVSTLHIDEILSVLGKLLKSCDRPVISLANQVAYPINKCAFNESNFHLRRCM